MDDNNQDFLASEAAEQLARSVKVGFIIGTTVHAVAAVVLSENLSQFIANAWLSPFVGVSAALLGFAEERYFQIMFESLKFPSRAARIVRNSSRLFFLLIGGGALIYLIPISDRLSLETAFLCLFILPQVALIILPVSGIGILVFRVFSDSRGDISSHRISDSSPTHTQLPK